MHYIMKILKVYLIKAFKLSLFYKKYLIDLNVV